jgi:hypothetical protein
MNGFFHSFALCFIPWLWLIMGMMGWDDALIMAAMMMASTAASYGMARLTRPKIPEAAPPAGYASPEGTQVWNAAKNMYEWVPAPKTPEQQAQEATRNTRIAEIEAGLNQFTPERQAEVEKYQKAYVDQMMTPLTDAYEKAKQNLNENFASRGLSGSRAMVDALAELDKDWQTTQTNVQNQSVQMGEQLKQQDYQNKLAELQALREGASLEEAEGIRQQGLAQTATSAANQINAANWQNMMGATLQQWAIGQQAIQSGMQAGGNLALLYGLGTTTAAKAPSSQGALQPGRLSQLYAGSTSFPGGYAAASQYPGLWGR